MSLVRVTALVGGFAATFACSSHVHAQRMLPLGEDGPSLHLEITKPIVARDGPFAGARLATSVWDASLVLPLDAGPTLFARWGLAYGSIEGLDDGLTLANPRVGVMIGQAEGGRAELHVDLPLGQELGENYVTGIAIFSDFEELERFAQDTWSLGASASAQVEPGPGAFLGAGVGGTLLVPTAGSADALGLFSLFGHAPTDRTRFRFEFSGSVLATKTGLTFSERTTFFASLEVIWPFTRFAPAVFVRAPIDETIDHRVPIVAGLRLRFGE